jgi:hypothetical protein
LTFVAVIDGGAEIAPWGDVQEQEDKQEAGCGASHVWAPTAGDESLRE